MKPRTSVVRGDNVVLTMHMLRKIYGNSGADADADGNPASMLCCPTCRGVSFYVAVRYNDSTLRLACSSRECVGQPGTASFKIAEGAPWPRH